MGPFALFGGALVFFHSSEFLLAAIFMRHELSVRSLLFSKAYVIAMSMATAEYWLGAWLWPSGKTMGHIPRVGLLLVVAGELIRKTGMLTAQANFTHNIRVQRDQGHRLVTQGIYRYVRHPGYLGWYVWCVGTQVLLVNPLSCVAFALVAWQFFRERIEYEEHYLRRFFGREYEEYAGRTPTWFPFIP